jgi:hypothetical protein
MKAIKYFFFALLMGFAFQSNAQVVKKTLATDLSFKQFKDTLVIGYPNPVTVTHPKGTGYTITIDKGCTVAQGQTATEFVITAPRASIDQTAVLVVTMQTSNGPVEVLKKQVRIVSASPSLISRMKP